MAVTLHTLMLTVASFDVQGGELVFDTWYVKLSGPTYPAIGVYFTMQPAQAPVPVQPMICAVPCMGGVTITRLAQSSTPHVVASFASTGMFTIDPAHTVAVSLFAETPHTVTFTVAMFDVQGADWLFETLYAKLSGPV
jgi:hypothetical protein